MKITNLYQIFLTLILCIFIFAPIFYLDGPKILYNFESVYYFSPQEKEPEVNSGVKVIWEKKEVLGVYKPPDLPMHEGGLYRFNTFEHLVKQKIHPECSSVHRLDKETSGVVLCSSSSEVRGLLAKSLRERSVTKTYDAIVFGKALKSNWTATQPIGQITTPHQRVKQAVCENGLPSETHFEVLRTTDNFSWLRCYPKTGRTHQIRVHAAFYGHHLVGDNRYNPDDSLFSEFLLKGFTKKVAKKCLTKRLCLHAKSISFVHPITKEITDINIGEDNEMLQIWNQLTEGKTYAL